MKLSAILLYCCTVSAPAAVEEIKLWPDGAPGQMQPHSKATEDFIRTKSGKSTITDIHEPTITVYRPEKPNGTSVIVAPGGGYVFLSAVHEGSQVCEWLNTIGVTGILLKYRTPTRDEAAPHEKPVQDALQALAIVRSRSEEWGLNPRRVGLLGFSAGGNLLAHLACDRPESLPLAPSYLELLKILKMSPLPNFGIMIYGGGFVEYKEPTKLKEGFTVPADAPPMFLACAHDDGQNSTAATVLYLEYKKHNIPCELHLFTKGGHGFGMRKAGNPINDWPQRCAEWMRSMGNHRSVDDLNKEIALREKKLEDIVNLIHSYGDDLPIMLSELESLAKSLKTAKKQERTELQKELQARMAQIKRAMDEEAKRLEALPKPETLAHDIARIKKEKLELEAERELLLQKQSTEKTP
ncbi:MAG: alpha/beta hydrolase fold domain-containing protein [Prosthecobacter sp.]